MWKSPIILLHSDCNWNSAHYNTDISLKVCDISPDYRSFENFILQVNRNEFFIHFFLYPLTALVNKSSPKNHGVNHVIYIPDVQKNSPTFFVDARQISKIENFLWLLTNNEYTHREFPKRRVQALDDKRAHLNAHILYRKTKSQSDYAFFRTRQTTPI